MLLLKQVVPLVARTLASRQKQPASQAKGQPPAGQATAAAAEEEAKAGAGAVQSSGDVGECPAGSGTAFKEWLALGGLQCGKSKVFMRMASFAVLESLRSQGLKVAAVRCQSWARRVAAATTYRGVLASLLIVTCAVRRFLARVRVQHRRDKRAATAVQATWRRSRAQKVSPPSKGAL